MFITVFESFTLLLTIFSTKKNALNFVSIFKFSHFHSIVHWALPIRSSFVSFSVLHFHHYFFLSVENQTEKKLEKKEIEMLTSKLKEWIFQLSSFLISYLSLKSIWIDTHTLTPTHIHPKLLIAFRYFSVHFHFHIVPKLTLCVFFLVLFSHFNLLIIGNLFLMSWLI